MSKCKIIATALGLLTATQAMADSPRQAELAAILTEMGPALGRIDYCGGGGQELFGAYARGLEHFGLRPTELHALLAMTQAGRERAQAEAARKFDGRPCPAEVREVVQRARGQMDQAWRQVVQNAPSVDLRSALASVLGAPEPASAPPPASAPASATAHATASSSSLCVKGRGISVLHAGDWYPAKVLDGPDSLGTCLVSYDNYDSNWDEWVNAGRMRAATAAPSPAAAKQRQATADVVPGTYNCYTFDSGALNYSYTDVRILDRTRYAVGDSSGTYRSSASGAMSFTGTLSNATGTFSVKATGKPQIDLVFNGDARSSMACSKAR